MTFKAESAGVLKAFLIQSVHGYHSPQSVSQRERERKWVGGEKERERERVRSRIWLLYYYFSAE
jgi:hypothetical protein